MEAEDSQVASTPMSGVLAANQVAQIDSFFPHLMGEKEQELWRCACECMLE